MHDAANDNLITLLPTLTELIQQEGLSRAQAARVRDGLRWAQHFGLLRHAHWKRYRFDVRDVKMALILSIIVEVARSSGK